MQAQRKRAWSRRTTEEKSLDRLYQSMIEGEVEQTGKVLYLHNNLPNKFRFGDRLRIRAHQLYVASFLICLESSENKFKVFPLKSVATKQIQQALKTFHCNFDSSDYILIMENADETTLLNLKAALNKVAIQAGL